MCAVVHAAGTVSRSVEDIFDAEHMHLYGEKDRTKPEIPWLAERSNVTLSNSTLFVGCVLLRRQFAITPLYAAQRSLNLPCLTRSLLITGCFIRTHPLMTAPGPTTRRLLLSCFRAGTLHKWGAKGTVATSRPCT